MAFKRTSTVLRNLRGSKEFQKDVGDIVEAGVRLRSQTKAGRAGDTGPTKSQAPVRESRVTSTKRRAKRGMGQNAVHIHEDHDVRSRTVQSAKRLKTQEAPALASDDDVADGTSDANEESGDEVDDSVAEDMRKLEENFEGISQRYRLINRIGEGTFSTVYKAEQLCPEVDANDPEKDFPIEAEETDFDAPPTKRRKVNSSPSYSNVPRRRHRPQFVALKKIYVTSSPHRIANELELLHALRDSPYICPLLTAFRHLDQVVAVLPYFRHLDFRLYYRDFLVSDMRCYFKSLFSALHHVHRAGILHRDIKPTNFLYNHARRQGVLVDFGLAEKQGTDWQPCLCLENREKRKERFLNSFAVDILQAQDECISTSYPAPKGDTRPPRRANRAGTRGFRAPEVLLKCTAQTTKIDIWSAGVILLTLLARRFPFFNSTDDVDAIIEMASIFGRRRMKNVAAMHGSVFETNIETIGERGFNLSKIVLWASCREEEKLRAGDQQAVSFLEGLLELDPSKRWTAKEALQHEFITAPVEDQEERAEREAQWAEEEARIK